MKLRSSQSAAIAAVLAGALLGIGLSTSWSASEVRDALPQVLNVPAPAALLEPVTALPRTTLAIAMEEARGNLGEERPWAAWEALRPHLDQPGDKAPAAVLLGARAASGWGGWREVRQLLGKRDWLDSEEGGQGWYLLGRAEEAAENWKEAASAYRRYVQLAHGRERGLAAARLGAVLQKSGQDARAAAAFRAAAADVPVIADWLRALEAEAAVEDGLPVTSASALGDAAPARIRRARAQVRSLTSRGDTAGAVGVLEREARALAVQGDAWEAGPVALDRARLLLAQRRTGEAREILRATAADATLPSAVRRAAAARLGQVPGNLTAAEQLARAGAYEAADQPGLAARSLRAAGAADNPALQLRLGMLLFQAGDLGPARAALSSAAERLDRDGAAQAQLYAARARIRGGDRSGGIDELLRLVERRGGTAAAGTAYFLLGDLGPDPERAIVRYRQSAAVPQSPDAREASFRVGDRSLHAGRQQDAAEAWEAYVARYPRGEQTAEAAYRAGVLRERAGRGEQARAMYTAATLADPVSYYAVLAANRLGTDPLAGVLRDPRPWVGLASDAQDAARVLDRLGRLEEAGLDGAWEEELGAAERGFAGRPLALLTLAEGLRDGGHTISGIRIGRRLLEMRGGAWDRRLLQVVFPLPQRELVEREARREGVDPMLLAGLVRQESSWNPAARSWVGATGLAQIMPSTGRWLAPAAGLDDWDNRYLSVPEVNLRMGAKYLDDLLDRYDGAEDLALAGYNAGPGRADRWRREFGHARNPERFREQIPFAETRHYVQVVLRNAALYRSLYGDVRPGLARRYRD